MTLIHSTYSDDAKSNDTVPIQEYCFQQHRVVQMVVYLRCIPERHITSTRLWRHPANISALVLYIYRPDTYHGMMSRKRPNKRYTRTLMFFACNSDGKRPAMARRFRNLHNPIHRAHWNICIYKSETQINHGCKLV